MGNWKELGVVPDSDDDEFISEESQPLSTSHSPSHPRADPRIDDIWELPGSPISLHNTIIEARETPRSIPKPSSAHKTILGQSVSQSLGEERISRARTEVRDDGDLPKRIQDSPDPLADTPTRTKPTEAIPERDEISSDAIHRSSPSTNSFLGNPQRNQGTNEASPNEEINKEHCIEVPAEGNKSDNRQAIPPIESPAHGYRSLRPRKPIQEHPYLLENAQYSRFMKTHGVKPVRVPIQDQPSTKQQNEKDSQDREYTGDESLVTSGRPDGESQTQQMVASRRVLDDDSDLDELALSPSPRTSSPRLHLRASSEHSHEQQTDDTSINEDEEFPDIRDIVGMQKKLSIKPPKRRTPADPSMSRKRLKIKRVTAPPSSPNTTEIWDVPSSPGLFRSTSPERTPFSLSTSNRSRLPAVPSLPTASSKHPGPSPRPNTPAEPVDLTLSAEESAPEGDGVSDSQSLTSESDSEMVRQTGRRIKGVLPASWLRLDQQTRKIVTRKAVIRQSSPHSPDQPRPGLAVRKSGVSKPAVSARSFFDMLNDDGNDDDKDDDYEARPNHKTPHQDLERERAFEGTEMLNFDDSLSVVEDDHIDRMLSGHKRSHISSGGLPKKRQKVQQKVFKGPDHKRYQQPKISQSVRRLDRLSNSVARLGHLGTNDRTIQYMERAISPPALSIVDFVEPNAPKFIKIAARAASRRKDMGRSKPSNKNINLGNRSDNVDALSVLSEWKTGRIDRRTSKIPRLPNKSRAQEMPRKERQPLRSLSANIKQKAKPTNRLSFTQPQKLTRQISIDNFASSKERGQPREGQSTLPPGPRRTKSHLHNGNHNHRPAQLEEDVFQDTDVAFTTRKKVLDLVFHRSRAEILAPSFQLQQPAPDDAVVHHELLGATPQTSYRPNSNTTGIERRDGSKNDATARPRPRKLAAPRRLDLEAPQFKHANDPLPFVNIQEVQEHPQPLPDPGKILGLGPFGTQYTKHFDIFPLHEDTYFHHSTLIGNGTLKNALDCHFSDTTIHIRPTTSFDISNHQFQWGCWTETTSSELGLVFDLVVEQLEQNGATDSPTSWHQATTCADNVLRYMLQSIRLDEEKTLRAFTQRLSELLLNFLSQTQPILTAHGHRHTLLEIYSRFLLCALVLLRFCQGALDLSSDSLQAEEILKQYAEVVIQLLLETRLSAVRKTYDNLQRLSARECGIRKDDVPIISWVIVIKVLGSAQIPRAGFWDLTSSAMTTMNFLNTHEVQRFETLWEDMFTLLPLGEFDDNGVLSKGLRFTVSFQGWSLPQKLLKRVFDSYQSNQRQSPSFNEYCRALLGRCHYLIEQWGWYKCVGVVGTIFDFFGHQNLSHLRNEEVYKSPQFLEELSGSPCLSIEPEDRCFHIFLKILALAIQHMKRRSLSNDIRNLIARCLPNHNRQYSKEQTIHSHDLGSLRNHHDLLCALFWSAPPEDRRPVELIEKLVQPASSHKEACLINLRAWSQLARFVVSSGASIDEYRPFMTWQNNVFQQILNQYLTAASDVQEQFMLMAKEKRRDIQQHMLDAIVSANQAAAKDVLYFSIRASLDVMRHCPSLATATFSFNTSQLNKAFDKLIVIDSDLDWSVLQACFDTVDIFVKSLEELWYKLKEATCDTISSYENRPFEDAVDFFDDKVVSGFFATIRRVLDLSASSSVIQPASHAAVVEKAIILCGRIASLFIGGEKTQVKHFFSPGKYCLFEGHPHELNLAVRKFVPLFVATLLKNDLFNFSSIGCSHFDIWIMSLVKPFHALRYENYLAETFKSLDVRFMKGAIVTNGAAPNYNTNRDFFACGISFMRRDLRQADTIQRKPLRAGYEKLLKLVMQQMKLNIKTLKLDSTEHQDYISFIREIVGIIKSHAADICMVDPFYYQVSAEYSPAKEDPQLHTAGILAYGLRLEEGDNTAISQLFYYLGNYFKSALAIGELDTESKVIQNGMKDNNILVFIVGRMLPAIIRASSQNLHIWPLLGVYSKAVRDIFTRSFLPREIPQNHLDDVLRLLDSVLDWVRNISENNTQVAGLTPTQAHVFTELIGICNNVRPFLMCWLLQPRFDLDRRLQDSVDKITRLAKPAATYLDQLRVSRGSEIAIRDVRIKELFVGWESINTGLLPQADSQINEFTQHLLREVGTNWVITEDTITVKAAMTSSALTGTQSARGIKNDLETRRGILSELLAGLKSWVDEVGEDEEDRSRRKRRRRPRRI